MKHCSNKKCCQTNPQSYDNFYRLKNGKFRPWCKACTNAKARQWHVNNKDKSRKAAMEWHRRNKDKCRIIKERWTKNNPNRAKACYLRKYWPELTPEQALNAYDILFKSQNGVCAICKKPENKVDSRSGKIKDLCVDHNHLTNKVRGLLCHNCNTAIGFLFADEGTAMLNSATEYVLRH